MTQDKNKINNRGFSLVELSVVLLIVGLMMSTAIATYNFYKKQHELSVTTAAANSVRIGLQKFVAVNKRYPCPADPSLPSTAPNAGVERCTQLTALTVVPSCINGRLCVNRNPARSNSRITYGAVPYATIGILSRETYDGWNNQLGYAVTEILTQAPPAGYGPNKGAIRIADPAGASPDPSVADPETFEFVVWSYGSGKRGASTPAGKMPVACAGGVPDVENCNNDKLFLTSTAYDNLGNVIQSIRSYQAANFYDSYILVYTLSLSTDLWSTLPGFSDQITNAFGGNVGIGTSNPSSKLDIVGNLKVAEVRGNLYSTLDPSLIGGGVDTANSIGSGAECYGGSLQGFDFNGKPYCGKNTISYATAWPPGVVDGRTCPIWQYMAGLTSTGTGIICRSM